MSNKIEWRPGMTVARLCDWRRAPTLHTVVRVTPSGRAVMSNGHTVTPDGRQYGGPNRYAVATDEHLEKVAHEKAVRDVESALDSWRYRFRKAGKPDHDTCKALLAALESVEVGND